MKEAKEGVRGIPWEYFAFFLCKRIPCGKKFPREGEEYPLSLSHPEPLSMLTKSRRHICTYVLDVQREVYLYHTFFSTG